MHGPRYSYIVNAILLHFNNILLFAYGAPLVSLKQGMERHLLGRLQPISLIIFDTLSSLNHVEGVDQPRLVRGIWRRLVHHTPCTYLMSFKSRDTGPNSTTYHGSKLKSQEDKALLSSLPSHPNSPYLVPPREHQQK